MITGAAGGLGKALAAEYGERGHPLFLTDICAGRLDAFVRGLGSAALEAPLAIS